jgi:hypothetical protein
MDQPDDAGDRDGEMFGVYFAGARGDYFGFLGQY